jgi:phosphatidylserine/phosphatidylglycerophosphate/cardiolipin synthase-like enzyme
MSTIAPTSSPSPAASSGIRDNHYCGSVSDFLKPHIRDGSHMAVVSAYFTIYAYAALKDWLDRIGHMDFLFGEPSFVKSLDPAKTETKAFIIAPEGLKLANTLQQKRVARECADWITKKVDIKTVCQTGFLHGKLYHVDNDGRDAVAILGSSNFTPRGLGLQDTGSNIELNLIASDPADRDQLKAWFDRLWSDPTWSRMSKPMSSNTWRRYIRTIPRSSSTTRPCSTFLRSSSATPAKRTPTWARPRSLTRRFGRPSSISRKTGSRA